MDTLYLCFGLTALFLVTVESSRLTAGEETSRAFNSAHSPLTYFNESDALAVVWYHGANSLEQMEEALTEGYMMLEGDITLEWYGFPNQTNNPIMAHPPAVTSDNTLDNWLDNILNTPGKAPKLDFKNEEVMEPSLVILESKSAQVNCPVWVNADIVRGPGTVQQPIDADSFFQAVNTYFPNMTLSLGWTTGCCSRPFTMEMMEEMWAKVQDILQPVTFPARAALLKMSWDEFRWLLSQDPGRFSLTVWTPQGATDWEGATEYDLLYVRNDVAKTVIYYDLPGPRLQTFKHLAVTAGSPLNHFPGIDVTWDAMDVTWAHRVNSQNDMGEALQGDLMMFEADVILRGHGTENETDIPVMGHPPDTDGDLTLWQWLDIVRNTSRGMKLDFKSLGALNSSVKILKEFLDPFDYQQPVWINADIFKGPNSPDSNPVDPEGFRQLVLDYFPVATLSIGWTTTWPGSEGYTQDMVDTMATYAQQWDLPITFPVRAAFVRGSWDQLKWLLDQSRGYTLTIWSGSTDLVDAEDLVYVRNNYETSKVYYDLPDWLMDNFLEALNQTAAIQNAGPESPIHLDTRLTLLLLVCATFYINH